MPFIRGRCALNLFHEMLSCKLAVSIGNHPVHTYHYDVMVIHVSAITSNSMTWHSRNTVARSMMGCPDTLLKIVVNYWHRLMIWRRSQAKALCTLPDRDLIVVLGGTNSVTIAPVFSEFACHPTSNAQQQVPLQRWADVKSLNKIEVDPLHLI